MPRGYDALLTRAPGPRGASSRAGFRTFAKKPSMPHAYPDFARVLDIDEHECRRYSLEIAFGASGGGALMVIQKNPSRAGAQVSDHTVNRVLRYLHHHRGETPWLHTIGKVVFLNLIPWYETYSENLLRIPQALADPRNLRTIAGFASTGGPCIVGWGNPPKGLTAPYEALAARVLDMLRDAGNPVFHVGDLTRLGHPRHGQYWAYRQPLLPL